MPELPEVETVRIGLARLLPGKSIAKVDFDWPKSFPNVPSEVKQFLVGAEVIEVKRRAKVLLIELSTKYSLIIHLKMTGQLVFIGTQQKQIRNSNVETLNKSKIQNYNSRTGAAAAGLGFRDSDLGFAEADIRFGAGHPNDSLIGTLPDKSTRVTLTFTDGSKLFFNDQRKFGWMRLLPAAEVVNLDFFQKVGPEPLAADFTAQKFRERLLRRPNSGVKAVLLDQTVVAGVGNIYADESLWGAKLHPSTLVKTLSLARTKKLFEELQYVLKLAIEKGGSTDRNYINAEGKKGSYLSFARVFRREGQPCPRCGTIIIKIRVAGRGTHICPKCQKV